MLFVIVNIARFVKVDPEQALRRTNAKFRLRPATDLAAIYAAFFGMTSRSITALSSESRSKRF